MYIAQSVPFWLLAYIEEQQLRYITFKGAVRGQPEVNTLIYFARIPVAS
jgi:hypothetical protein